MAKKIVNLLVLLPIGIILIIFCVANRQLVTMAFNPFRPEDQVLSLSAPLFVFLFVTLILGMVIGSAATWFTQGVIVNVPARKPARPSVGRPRLTAIAIAPNRSPAICR